MTHMLKAGKQLTANRLCRGSGISEHNWGRAAQQTDPVTTGTPGSAGTVLPLSILPITGACLFMKGWFAPAPWHKKGEEGVGIIPPPCGCSVPLYWLRDPLLTQPSLAFGLKPWQFV